MGRVDSYSQIFGLSKNESTFISEINSLLHIFRYLTDIKVHPKTQKVSLPDPVFSLGVLLIHTNNILYYIALS